jgi:hypothetical protein
MKVSLVDISKKTNLILEALNREEEMIVEHRGKSIAIMKPIESQTGQTRRSVKDHPAFGIWADRPFKSLRFRR